MEARHLAELVDGQAGELNVPAHGQVGAVDLEDEARFRHGLVLVLHRVGDGVQVRLVAPVVVVAEEEGDDAR